MEIGSEPFSIDLFYLLDLAEPLVVFENPQIDRKQTQCEDEDAENK